MIEDLFDMNIKFASFAKTIKYAGLVKLVISFSLLDQYLDSSPVADNLS